MGLAANQGVDVEQPLHDIGLDSLMAVELRNAIGGGLELDGALPATLLFDYPTISAVAAFLAEEVLHLNGNGAIETDPPEEQKHDDLDELTDEQAEALLLEELGEK